jgi:DNA topoisomerase I
MNLVIVESPTKCKIISKLLNNLKDFKNPFYVTASKGHICVLDEKVLSIEIDSEKQTFTPKYVIGKGQEELVKRLKKLCKQADTVWLASDNDREGEAIAYHISRTFSKELKGKVVHRVIFNEITQSALASSFRNPTTINYDLVSSQECRRMLDRIVGYKLSPQLWNTFPNESITLSAGRVQSAALHLLLEHEKSIQQFLHESVSHWQCSAVFKNLGRCVLYKSGKPHFMDAKVQAKIFLKQLFMDFSVKNIDEYETNISPDVPFTTSGLQQASYTKLNFSPKQTMQIAQRLYEQGKITYMRTDSTYINPGYISDCRDYISSKYGVEYVSPKQKHMIKSAHEAIRPTTTDYVVDGLSSEENKLYKLIFNRTIGFFMSDSVYSHYDVHIIDVGFESSMYFNMVNKKLKFAGHKILFDRNIDAGGVNNMNKMQIDEILKTNKDMHEIEMRQSWLDAPLHYNDATFIKKMDHLGLGRPSTYSTILGKLYDKHYIQKKDIDARIVKTQCYVRKCNKIESSEKDIKIGSEKSKIVVTDLGSRIDRYLEDGFNYIIDSKFTKNMEDALDNIASNQTSQNKVLWQFWGRFEEDLKKNKVVNSGVFGTDSRTINIGKTTYVVRHAKYGPVIENKSKREFISLTYYLSEIKKTSSLESITEFDIIFLTSLPKKCGNLGIVYYGPYGFYTKQNGFNKKLGVEKIIEAAGLNVTSHQ